MAKIAYSKLGLKIDDSIEIVEWNDQQIEVKKYLPIQKKMEIVDRVVNATLSADDKIFNIPQVLVNVGLEMVYNYTNISFTEKQKEDGLKLYDVLVSSTLLGQILAVCERDYSAIQTWTIDVLTKLYDQYNSLRGVLASLSSDYNNMEFDIEKLQKEISDPEKFGLLKDVLSKLD